jgi:predicted RNA-binding Zn-ribbon protein involved in translation (DUF1610 family)
MAHVVATAYCAECDNPLDQGWCSHCNCPVNMQDMYLKFRCSACGGPVHKTGTTYECTRCGKALQQG